MVQLSGRRGLRGRHDQCDDPGGVCRSRIRREHQRKHIQLYDRRTFQGTQEQILIIFLAHDRVGSSATPRLAKVACNRGHREGDCPFWRRSLPGKTAGLPLTALSLTAAGHGALQFLECLPALPVRKNPDPDGAERIDEPYPRCLIPDTRNKENYRKVHARL